MKFTLNNLKNFLDTDCDVYKIAEALTSLGLEVESVDDQGKKYQNFIVAEIISAEKHPDANSLQVCQVFDGKENLQIVCGAPNARSGIKVILAPIGTHIPRDDFTIKKTNIRGQESNGMLCSASELLLSDDAEGIIELPAKTQVGISLLEALDLNQQLIEISVTPNRGDCLGIYGIARDLAAKNIGHLKTLSYKNFESEVSCPIKVNLEDSACSYALFRYIKNIDNSFSPEGLKKFLTSVGSKTISFAVDVTNYFTFAYARPMHAFDADKIIGNIKIRKAVSGEKFIDLKENEIELNGGETVIADDQGVIALAGIIGGLRTSCDANTKNILLEIAYFDPIEIALAGRKHNINSDARYRFERIVDKNFIPQADALAVDLIKQYWPNAVVGELISIGKEQDEKTIIEYSVEDFISKSGFAIERTLIEDILVKLGFKVEKDFKLTVPSWRKDVAGKDDVTEEIIRIYGYDNVVPVRLPTSDNIKSGFALKPLQKRAKNLTYLLASLGYNEVVTWSFMSDKLAESFCELKDQLYIANPISVELNYMRPSIAPNLLKSILYNVNHGTHNVSFFELGPIFIGGMPGEQKNCCTAVKFGNRLEKNIYNTKEKFDVFDIKTDLFRLIESTGFDVSRLSIEQNSPSYFHPGQSATVKIGKTIIAYFGKIHPLIMKKFDLDDNGYAFELFYDDLPVSKNKNGKKDPYNPNPLALVKRDFAFVLPENFAVGEIVKIVNKIDKKFIDSVNIFDLYQGDKLLEGQKSVAFSVYFSPQEKSFTDGEIEILCSKIVSMVENETGGKLR